MHQECEASLPAKLFGRRLRFGISELRIPRIEQLLLLSPWHLLARSPDVRYWPSHSWCWTYAIVFPVCRHLMTMPMTLLSCWLLRY